jgi:multicomponent Na+:H+ antiporter subunit E
MSRVLTVAWLTALWIVLWRDLSVVNVAGGVLVATVIGWAVTLSSTGVSGRDVRFRPLPAVVFLGYFAWKLVEANLVLAREIVTPRNRIRTGIIAVPATGCSDLVVTVVANAVTLTPGTVTLEVRRVDGTCRLYVHVLHLHDMERARNDVRTLMRLAGRALQRDVPAPSAAPERPR